MDKRPLNPDPSLGAMQAHSAQAVRLLKALANERRFQVLCLLAGREHSVGELNGLLEMSQPALSQHLAVLRKIGLVETRRDGQTINYSLADGPGAAVMETLCRTCCGDGDSGSARP